MPRSMLARKFFHWLESPRSMVPDGEPSVWMTSSLASSSSTPRFQSLEISVMLLRSGISSRNGVNVTSSTCGTDGVLSPTVNGKTT